MFVRFAEAKRSKNKRVRVSLRRNAHHAETSAVNERFTEVKSAFLYKDMVWVEGPKFLNHDFIKSI